MGDDTFVVPGYNVVLREGDLSTAVPDCGRAFPMQNPKPKPMTEAERELKALQDMNSHAGFIFTFPLPEHIKPTSQKQKRLEQHRQSIVEDVHQKMRECKSSTARARGTVSRGRGRGGRGRGRVAAESQPRNSVSTEEFGGSLAEILEQNPDNLSALERERRKRRANKAKTIVGNRAEINSVINTMTEDILQEASHGHQTPTTAANDNHRRTRQHRSATLPCHGGGQGTFTDQQQYSDQIPVDDPSRTQSHNIVTSETTRALHNATTSPNSDTHLELILAQVRANVEAHEVVQELGVPHRDNRNLQTTLSHSRTNRQPDHTTTLHHVTTDMEHIGQPPLHINGTSGQPSSSSSSSRYLGPSSAPYSYDTNNDEPEEIIPPPLPLHLAPAYSPESPTRHTTTTTTTTSSPSSSTRRSRSRPFAPFATSADEFTPQQPQRPLRRTFNPANPLHQNPLGSGNGGDWELADFSYENLLELGSMAVCIGLSKQQIAKIPTYTFSPEAAQREKLAVNDCMICLEDFNEGDDIMQLVCNHGFHVPCITQWLLKNKKCPTCRNEVGRQPIAKSSRKPAVGAVPSGSVRSRSHLY